MSADYITSDGPNGTIGISEEVIASIASLAASEVEGLSDFVASVVDLTGFLGKKNLAKGVRVFLDGDSAVIDMFLRVKFGVKIRQFAAEVQSSVQSAVGSMAGLNVTAVNIRVAGVEYPQTEPPKACK